MKNCKDCTWARGLYNKIYGTPREWWMEEDYWENQKTFACPINGDRTCLAEDKQCIPYQAFTALKKKIRKKVSE